MANKPTLKKGAAKKTAVVVKKKSTPAKPASKAKPVAKKPVKAPAKPASKAKPVAKKPVAKAAPKPAAKAPAPKPASKPAPAPAAIVKKPEPAAPKPAPAPAPTPAPAPLARLLPGPKGSTTSGALTINVQTSQGTAGNGNTHPANILVIVTSGGTPVVELSRDHFTLMEHFEVPGQTACFSSNITSFRNAGTGAYLLQTRPNNGAPWRSGHHLGQLLISTDDDRQGQTAIKLIIR